MKRGNVVVEQMQFVSGHRVAADKLSGGATVCGRV
jgi:hypothetical protein